MHFPKTVSSDLRPQVGGVKGKQTISQILETLKFERLQVLLID